LMITSCFSVYLINASRSMYSFLSIFILHQPPYDVAAVAVLA
jgi:hypothetical protein